MNPLNIEVQKTMVLSTAHLTESTCNNFEGDTWIANHEFGVYFYVPSDPTNEDRDIPADLREVLIFAKKLGADEVKFDCDASTYPDHLTTYNW